MAAPDTLGYLALLGRIIGLGIERPTIKAISTAGTDAAGQPWTPHPIAACTFSFGIAWLLLALVVGFEWSASPGLFSTIGDWWWQALATGLLFTAAFHSYVWAMSVGEVSYLTPLYATGFVWLYVLDVLFGDAQLGWQAIGGTAAVALGVMLLNATPHKGEGRGASWHWREALNPLNTLRQPGAIGMLVYAFGLASGRVIDKSVSDVAPTLAYALCNNLLPVLLGLLWLLWKGRTGEFRLIARRRPLALLVSAVSGIFAYVCLLLALRHGFNPSVAEPVSQLSVFIAIALGGLLFKEPIRARWIPSALVVLGAALLLL
ncbi:EamA family transporter [bacterium]|nr:EamA family transporter [bacterium]